MMKIATKISPVTGFEYRFILDDERRLIAINYYFKGELIKKVPMKKHLHLTDLNIDDVFRRLFKETIGRAQ